MLYTTTITDKKDYLLIESEGKAKDFADIAAYTDLIISHSQRHRQKRILLDETSVTLSLDAHDASLLAERLVASMVPNMGIRVAAVCAPCNYAIARIIETAFQNRSLNFRMFEDMQSAIDWLK